MTKYLIDFIEEIVIPAKDKFPITYNLHHPLIAEDIINILEEQLESERTLNIRHFLGGMILSIKTYVEGNELLLQVFYDKKVLEFDIYYENEFLTVFELNTQDNCFDEINKLVNQIVNKLW